MSAWLVAAMLLVAPTGVGRPPRYVAYYVDARHGSDANRGTSPIAAWRSLAKASSVPSGSHLYLHADQVFTGTLIVSASRVEVSGYGAGRPPIIERGRYAGVEVQGDDVVVRDLLIRRNVAGVWTRASAERAIVEHNLIIDNNRMSVKTRGGRDDSGAFGVLIHGDRGEFHDNVVVGSDAFSYDYGTRRCGLRGLRRQPQPHLPEHRRDNETFVELGKASSDPESVDNQFSYNQITGAGAKMLGIVTRGKDTKGPVHDTRFSNNTIDLRGRGSQGFVCSACSSDVLVMDNNIVRAEGKVGFVSGTSGAITTCTGRPMRFRLRPTTSSPTRASCPMRTCISAPPRRHTTPVPRRRRASTSTAHRSRRRPRPIGARTSSRDPTVIEAQPDLQQHDVPLHAHRGIA